MILSASRRTDIPAFYAEWFMDKVRKGYCHVPNPYDHSQVRRVSLLPQDVDALIFWTRNPEPMLPFLKEIEDRGLPVFFQITLTNYPLILEPNAPDLRTVLQCFSEIAETCGENRAVWRYDPVVMSSSTSQAFHEDNYAMLVEELAGRVHRVRFSFMDRYKKIEPRLRQLERRGVHIRVPTEMELHNLCTLFLKLAVEKGMEIASCTDGWNLGRFGVPSGACIDVEWIGAVLGRELHGDTDPYQRSGCKCSISRDVGMYDSCTHGCVYCYANASFEKAAKNMAKASISSGSLLGNYSPAQKSLFDL